MTDNDYYDYDCDYYSNYYYSNYYYSNYYYSATPTFRSSSYRPAC